MKKILYILIACFALISCDQYTQSGINVLGGPCDVTVVNSSSYDALVYSPDYGVLCNVSASGAYTCNLAKHGDYKSALGKDIILKCEYQKPGSIDVAKTATMTYTFFGDHKYKIIITNNNFGVEPQ